MNPIFNEVELKKERWEQDRREKLRKTGLKEHEIQTELEKIDKEKGVEKDKKEVIICRTAIDVQKRKLDRLMKDPVKEPYIPQPRKEWKPRDPAEFVRHVMGSSAGAGSGEFHVYRNIRKRENKRQEYLERKAMKDDLDEQWKNKLEENQKKADDSTAKKRAKRQRKKQKKQLAKKMKKSTDKEDAPSESSEDEKEEEKEQKEDKGAEEEPHFVVGGK